MRAMLASFVDELGEVDFTLLYQFRDRGLRLSFKENVRDLPIIIPPTEALGGIAERKEIRVQFGNGPDSPGMDLLIYLPRERSGPVPAFVGQTVR